MSILYFILGALWRKLYGGGFGKFGNITRFWKYLVLAIIMLSMFYLKNKLVWTDWKIYADIVFFMIFWAIGHGAWFVYWDHSDSAEGRKPLIDKILWFLVGVDESRTELGNCLGMCIRYTLTSIGLAITVHPAFMFAGAIVAMCYVPAGIKHDTRIGELLAGGSIFTLLWCLL